MGPCQVMADVALSAGGDLAAFVALHNSVKIGDIVGAAGHPGKSKKGELSLFPTSFQVLSPCLHMLPLRRLDNQVPLPPFPARLNCHFARTLCRQCSCRSHSALPIDVAKPALARYIGSPPSRSIFCCFLGVKRPHIILEHHAAARQGMAAPHCLTSVPALDGLL